MVGTPEAPSTAGDHRFHPLMTCEEFYTVCPAIARYVIIHTMT
jgi:hypothetical protein